MQNIPSETDVNSIEFKTDPKNQIKKEIDGMSDEEFKEYVSKKYFPTIYNAENELEDMNTEEFLPKCVKEVMDTESTSLKVIQLDENIKDNIMVIEDVLTESECDWIFERAQRLGFEPATTYSTELDANVVVKEIRDNYRVLEINEILAKKLFTVVSLFIPQKIEDKTKDSLFHMFRYYKYVEGQSFAPHVDHEVFSEELDGRESKYTCLFYLKCDCKGGGTRFPDIDTTVEAKTGQVVLFRHKNLHEGLLVESGTKCAFRSDVMYK